MCDHNWTMSDERAFMENLLCSRFNFFLVFVSLIIAGAVSTENPVHFKIVLVFGALISLPLAGTIWRTQRKLNIALNDYLFRESDHPAKKLKDACNKKKGMPSMRNWIGYWIPLACCTLLVIGAVLALCDRLKPLQSIAQSTVNETLDTAGNG